MTPGLQAALAFTIGYGVPGWGQEGAFSDNPADPGGATYRGVTLADYRAWSGNLSATADDLQTMTDPQLAAFYGTYFWNPVRGESLPRGIDLSVFDHGVNTGPNTSAMLLQRVLGVTADGFIGPETLGAAARTDAVTAIGMLYTAQTLYYKGLAQYSIFGTGWSARALARKDAAIASAGA